MMKAIASPSSVVCTVSPLEHEPEKRTFPPPKTSCSNNQAKARSPFESGGSRFEGLRPVRLRGMTCVCLDLVPIAPRSEGKARAEISAPARTYIRENYGEVTATSDETFAVTSLRAAASVRAGRRSAAIPDFPRRQVAAPAAGAAASRLRFRPRCARAGHQGRSECPRRTTADARSDG